MVRLMQAFPALLGVYFAAMGMVVLSVLWSSDFILGAALFVGSILAGFSIVLGIACVVFATKVPAMLQELRS